VLEAIGEWLAAHCGDGGVMSCSALRRKYSRPVAPPLPDVEFMHLSGTPEVIGKRQASRPGHFMPRRWCISVRHLDPLSPMRAASSFDVDQNIDSSSTTSSRYPQRAQPKQEHR